MKILWFTEFYPKESEHIVGGVQARCFYVGKYLSTRNTLKVIGGVPSKYAKFSFFSFFLRFLLIPVEVINGLATDFDVIEASNTVMYFPAWIVGKLKRKPVIFWYPDVLLGSWLKNFGAVGIIGEGVERINLTLGASHFIAISNVVKKKLMSYGIPEEKISVIYCGVDKEEIDSIKKQAKTRDLIAVSRLIKYKNIDKLILSLPSKISLAIIGWGPEEKKLKVLAKGKDVTFLGKLDSHTDVLKEIASSKILCHPSDVEGFGISIIEAMALGVPVAIPKTEIGQEVTKGGQGAVTDYMEILNNSKLYNQKAKEAAVVGQSYDWLKIAKQTEDLYENLCNN